MTNLKAAWNDNTVRVNDDAITLLVQSYRWHRQLDSRRSPEMCIHEARRDVLNNKRRYPAMRAYPAVSWQSEAKPHDAIGTWSNPFPAKSDRLAGVSDPASAGLRFVGRVMPELSRPLWFSESQFYGWNTDPSGDVFKDGSGLCYGVVYQLPGRDGKTRFLAGYEFGGIEGGPTIDFSRIYEDSDSRGPHYSEDAQDYRAAREAARAADNMAQEAAEKEREYQAAWQAGNQYSECLEELSENRKETLQTIHELKGACDLVRQLPAVLQSAIRRIIENALESRSDIFARMETLKEGNAADFGFYPDTRTKEAFNEAAGKTVLV